MIGLTAVGLDSLIKDIGNMEKNLPKAIKQTMSDACKEALDEARRLCPIDTGELHDSIYCNTHVDGIELGASAKHAVFNEFGCYNIKVPGQAKYHGVRPFLRPALYKALDNFESNFNKNMKL